MEGESEWTSVNWLTFSAEEQRDVLGAMDVQLAQWRILHGRHAGGNGFQGRYTTRAGREYRATYQNGVWRHLEWREVKRKD